MSTIQMRIEVGNLLDVADDRLLFAVFALMKSYLSHNADATLGSMPDGTPLTRESMLNWVEASRTEATPANGKTAGDLLAEIEKW